MPFIDLPEVFGQKTDAKSTATDGTAASAMQVLKQISASVQAPAIASLPALGLSASATFTPAAASHVAGDVHGGAQQFSLGAPSGSRFNIVSASLEIDGGTIETTAWTLHLYNVTPPSAIADDGAFDLPAGDRTAYLGSIALAQVVDLGSTLYIESNNIWKQIKLSGTSVFGYLVNGTTLTPQAVAHIVTLHGYTV